MSSTDRSFTSVSFFAFTTLVLCVLIISQCTMNGRKDDITLARVEAPLRMECLKNKGVWVPRDDDGRPPYVCKYK